METIFQTFQSVIVTLNMRSRSPSNQLVPPYQQCIHASLVKIHQMVQKIINGKATLTGSAPKTICPPHFWFGRHNYITLKCDLEPV